MDINLNVWYRNFKKITVLSQNDDKIVLSNNDVIKFKNGNTYFNNELICNIDCTDEELVELYKYYLKRKGYKIL